MLLLVRPAVGSDLVELAAAIGAVYHPGEKGHFAHRRNAAPPIADAPNNVEGLLVDEGFVRVLENLPFGAFVLDLLLQFVGLAMRLEVGGIALSRHRLIFKSSERAIGDFFPDINQSFSSFSGSFR